jgi:hypothetical protein
VISGSRRIDGVRAITSASAIIAGLAWIAKDLGSRISPDPDYWDCNSSYDYALNGIDTVAFLVLSLTLLGLYELFRPRLGRKALLGAVAGGGFAVAGVANLLEHCAALDSLGLAYVAGGMLGMLLLVGFELALTRSQLPIWCTGLLLLGTAAGLLLANQGGLIVFGCSWIVFGCLLGLNRLRLHQHWT